MHYKFKALSKFIRKRFNERKAFIPLHEPRFIGNERKYVLDAIDSTFVSSVGEYVKRFEDMMCSYTGAKYTVATVNGTSALHIALLLAGVQRDEEVITQALSFIATANAISYCGTSPVFLDVDKDTMGLSVESVQLFLQGNTKQIDGQCINKLTGKRIAAVVPMHTFGHPMRIAELVALCSEYNIPVVEDAAESLGSYYKGQHTGTFGKLGAFSFNGNKIVTCGGGGAIVTNDEDIAKKAKHLTTTAKVPHAWEFTHNAVGYNYRMPNLNAAVACAQLEQLDFFVEKKRELAYMYHQFCKENDIQCMLEPSNTESNYWLNALCLSDKLERDELLKFMNDNGIMCRPIWTLLNKMTMYAHCYADRQENAQWFEDRIVNIPSSAIL